VAGPGVGRPPSRDAHVSRIEASNTATDHRSAGGFAAPAPTWLPGRRTQIVWIAFVAAMSIVIGVLSLDGGGRQGGFPAQAVRPYPASGLETLGTGDAGNDRIFDLSEPLDTERWRGIVVHHLGRPAGDADEIHRVHVSQGLQGLGYHFVIGNGNGLSDGTIHVGYRWDRQLPGAHVAGPAGDEHNVRSIGICLVGNGDRRAFSDRQIGQLIRLVHRLQRRLDIPASRVYLHSELTAPVSSPGRLFPAAEFREQLLHDISPAS